MKWQPVGAHAYLLEVKTQDEVHLAWRAIQGASIPGVEEVVAGARTVLVIGGTQDRLQEVVTGAPSSRRTPTGDPISIDVCYDGPDLEEVAQLTGLERSEVIARHSRAQYTVAFLGFSPGFAYMTGGDELLRVPRRATPRTSVPAGSVAIAGPMTAVYPQATPGGWQLIGRTGAKLFDPARASPSLLIPGDRVSFRPAPTVGRGDGPEQPAPPPTGSEGPGAIDVLEPGALLTIQDRGRVGWAHLGVPRAGPADAGSAQRANALLGNDPDAALLEATLWGPTIRLGAARRVALCGASADITVDGLPARAGVALSLPAGAQLHVGRFRTGTRLYIAIEGGLEAPRVLGSRSTDTLSGLGPRPLRKGSRVALLPIPEHQSPGPPVRTGSTDRRDTYPFSTNLTVAARPGPRRDWLTTDGWNRLIAETFTVAPTSDRTGVRLTGPPLHRSRADELPSEGMVVGAVQVPPDGQPIVLMRNHPTTGGYPVVAVVDASGVDALAQAAPGTEVQFRIT